MRCPTEFEMCLKKKRLTDADLTDSHYTLAIKLCEIFAFSVALLLVRILPYVVRVHMHRIQSSVVGPMLLRKVSLLSQR